MQFSKVQISALINNHLKCENGLNEVMEMMLNAMMKSERSAQTDAQGIEYI